MQFFKDFFDKAVDPFANLVDPLAILEKLLQFAINSDHENFIELYTKKAPKCSQCPTCKQVNDKFLRLAMNNSSGQKIVDFLLENNYVDINYTDSTTMLSPLLHATNLTFTRSTYVEKLLKHGANICEKFNGSYPFFHYILMHMPNRMDLIEKCLANGVDINTRVENVSTYEHCVTHENNKLMQYLLLHGLTITTADKKKASSSSNYVWCQRDFLRNNHFPDWSFLMTLYCLKNKFVPVILTNEDRELYLDEEDLKVLPWPAKENPVTANVSLYTLHINNLIAGGYESDLNSNESDEDDYIHDY
jgi:hypothetical protein